METSMRPIAPVRTRQRRSSAELSQGSPAVLILPVLVGMATGFIPVVLAGCDRPAHATLADALWASAQWVAVLAGIMTGVWLCHWRLTGLDRPPLRLGLSMGLAALAIAAGVYAPWIVGLARGTTLSHPVAVPADQDLLSARYWEVVGSSYPPDYRIGVRRSSFADEYGLVVPGQQSFLGSGEGWHEFGWPIRVAWVRCRPDHLSYATFADLCESSRNLQVSTVRLAVSLLATIAVFFGIATAFALSRRWFRSRRNECPDCGHRLLADQSRCPECGCAVAAGLP